MWSVGEVSDPGLKSFSDSMKLYASASASAYLAVIIVCLTHEEHKGRLKLP